MERCLHGRMEYVVYVTPELEAQDVPKKEKLTLEEKNARLEVEINLLKAKNELLKKILFAEKGMKK
jgi:hypothetical protein